MAPSHGALGVEVSGELSGVTRDPSSGSLGSETSERAMPTGLHDLFWLALAETMRNGLARECYGILVGGFCKVRDNDGKLTRTQTNEP